MGTSVEGLDLGKVEVAPQPVGLEELLRLQDLTLCKEVEFEVLPLVKRDELG